MSFIPCIFILLMLGWYLLLGFFVQMIEDNMPPVISDYDVQRMDPNTFSETAALKYLDTILGGEPRVAGTKFHLQKTIDLKNLIDDIAQNSKQTILTDWQFVSDDYFLNLSAPFYNKYDNVSNIIAVLEGESGFHGNGTIGSSILVNCHYDSVPFAIGASDNGVFCAAMVEVLNRFGKRSEKFKHNIVFLFNGAEENSLQGSHGFLQHPWSKGVTVVVNLDATGMNGKPTVFQSNDLRVLQAYRRSVKTANAQGLGELLFSSGIIPSDTDFRVFRDFGQIYGIDIAFAKWGVVYHTRYDHPDLLRAGVVQNAGETLMHVLREVADMDELTDKTEPTNAIYYDYLNLFMVAYSKSSVAIYDTLILLVAVLSIVYYVWLVGFRWSTVKELLFASLSLIASAVGGLAVVMICTGFMLLTANQLRYLSRPWLLVPFYWIPYIIGAGITSHLFDKWRSQKHGLNRSVRCEQSAASCRLLLAATLAVMLLIPAVYSGVYLVSVPLVIMSITSVVSVTAVRYFRMSAWQHLLLSMILALPAIMFTFSITLRLFALAIPVLGRSPSLPPDVTAALVSVFMATLVCATICGTELLFSRRRWWVPVAVVSSICVILMLVPFSPYSDNGPATMRHYWFHSSMCRHNFSGDVTCRSGIVAIKMDVHTTKANAAAGGKLACESERIYCGYPVFRTSMAKNLDEALMFDSGPPDQFSPPAAMTYTRQCLQQNCVYNLTFYGAAHNTIALTPYAPAAVVGWSLSDAPLPAFTHRERPVYLLTQSYATYADTLPPFNISVTVNAPVEFQSQPLLEVSYHSHKIYHIEDFTPEYRAVLAAAPQYYHIATFISHRNDYEI